MDEYEDLTNEFEAEVPSEFGMENVDHDDEYEPWSSVPVGWPWGRSWDED